jgi:predicted metal-dependent hydrolase
MTATLTRRDVDLDFDPAAVPRDWYAGDGYATTFLNSLSMLFPEGEKFFVDSVKHYRDRVHDPALRAQIVGFIGQEAMHGREHRAFNDMLAAHGYRSGPGVDRWLRRFLGLVRAVFSPKSQLAITCALEHFTAMLAEQALESEHTREQIHPSVRPLWLWHMLEEAEHKAVAYDVYRAVGGGYLRRIWIMLLVSIAFVVVQTGVQWRLMATRRILWKPWRWGRALWWQWIAPGDFRRLVPRYLSYFRPRFHPNDRDNTALVAHWDAALFGAEGQMRDQLRAA